MTTMKSHEDLRSRTVLTWSRLAVESILSDFLANHTNLRVWPANLEHDKALPLSSGIACLSLNPLSPVSISINSSFPGPWRMVGPLHRRARRSRGVSCCWKIYCALVTLLVQRYQAPIYAPQLTSIRPSPKLTVEVRGQHRILHSSTPRLRTRSNARYGEQRC